MRMIARHLRLGCLTVLIVFLCFFSDVLSIDCNVTISINSSNKGGVFSSHSFPSSYPKLPEAYSCWYTLVPDDLSNHVQITFDDFHLSSEYSQSSPCNTQEVDYLAIYAGSKVTEYCGCLRPDMVTHYMGEIKLELRVQPALIDEASFRGFQVRFEYLTPTEYEDRQDIHFYSAKPNISNGYGFVEDPVAPLPATKTSAVIDGLYYIEAGPEMKIGLNAFIENAMPSSGRLEIRDGLTSQAALLYNGTLESEVTVVSSQSFLYIRWRGVTQGSTLTLKMKFTSFKDPVSAGRCESNEYFHCNNLRCIRSTLTCDSNDNCGDGSDEAGGSVDDVCHVEDDCDSSPCENGGSCFSPGPYCRCRYGYWGDYCQYVNMDCRSSPCQNDGTCQPYSNGPGFICFCRSGYHGPYCEDSTITVCQPGDCNEGSCINGKCNCKENYYGDHCEYYDNTTNTDYTDLQHTSIMIGAFVGAVCLLSICWLIAMARKRQTDEPVGRVQRIVSVHSRDERGMRPSVTAAGAIDLPPTYSDCVFDETDSPQVGKPIGVPAVITEENEEESEDVFVAEQGEGGPPLSPPPTYESVAQSEEDDGITFEVHSLPDVVSRDRPPQRQTSHIDTAV